jgi:hypothetical protein
MTPADREFALKGLDDSRERLLRAVRGLSRAQLEYRPAADRWSVAENLEHVIVAETYVHGRLEGLVREAPDSSRHSNWEGRDEPLVRRVAEAREDRVQAPERFRPIGRWPIEKLVAEFEAARALSREFAAFTQEDLRTRFFRHPAPAVGEIDGYQWLLLIAAHRDRHCWQSEEVMASPDFPRPGHRRGAGAASLLRTAF